MMRRGLKRPSRLAHADLDDEQLCALATEGDLEAVTELTSRHRGWLVELCRRQLYGDARMAEDIAQECLLKFHSALVRDHRPLRPRAWLSVVARNACIDVHRARRAVLSGDLPDQGVVDADPFDADPILAAAWEALSDRHRDVLHHRELMGLRYDEIAVLMDTSVSAVEALLFRARSALRRNYQQEGGALLGCGLFGLALGRLLDGNRSAELDAHLAACSGCAEASRRLAATTQLLRSGTTSVASPPLPVPASTRAVSGVLHRAATVLHHLPALGSAPAVITDAVSSVSPWMAAAVVSAGVMAGALVGAGPAPSLPRTTATASSVLQAAPLPSGIDAPIRTLQAGLPFLTPTTMGRSRPTGPHEWDWQTGQPSGGRAEPSGFEQCESTGAEEWSSAPSTWQRPPAQAREECDTRPTCTRPSTTTTSWQPSSEPTMCR
jgi:RNA polymerase sigma-70 factor (ECF subfamily)